MRSNLQISDLAYCFPKHTELLLANTRQKSNNVGLAPAKIQVLDYPQNEYFLWHCPKILVQTRCKHKWQAVEKVHMMFPFLGER